jgi:LacI family transcriptional regulator
VLHTARSMVEDGTDGLIRCPAYEQSHRSEWKALAERGIPMVFLGSDIPGVTCLSSVRLNAARCGRMACELLGAMVGDGPVAVLIGIRDHPDHKRKVEGFTGEAELSGRQVASVYEQMDDPSLSYPVTERIFSEHPGVQGLYIATDNSEGSCRYLVEHNLAGRVSVVGTGVFSQIRSMVEQGVVQFTLFQNMNCQGRLAVRSLYRYLSEHIEPPTESLVPPAVVMRSNLDLWK